MKDTALIIERAERYRVRFEELEWLISAPEVIADGRYYRKVIAEYSVLTPIIELLDELKVCHEYDLANEEQELAVKLLKLLAETERGISEIAVLEMHYTKEAANEFASLLYSAYNSFALDRGFDFEVINKTKFARVKGVGAYTVLQKECGIHEARLNDNFKISVTAIIYPEKSQDVQIDERDLEIDTFRSGGAGGQHVNKTESAIRITHIPTGISVVCQDERSQYKNKSRALEIIYKKIENHAEKKNAELTNEAKKNAQKTAGSGIVRNYDFRTGQCQNSESAQLSAIIDKSGKIEIF